MTVKKYSVDIFRCQNCPEFRKDWWYWFPLWIFVRGPGICKKGNIRIYDSREGIPKDCPLPEE